MNNSSIMSSLNKAWKHIPNADAERSPKVWFEDPRSVMNNLGVKERTSSVSFESLRRVVSQLGTARAIINTRKAQVAAFSEPYRKTKSLGFQIRHKDTDQIETEEETAFIKEMEQFILYCGRSEKNPHSRIKRDDFDGYLKKITEDTLILDAIATEIVPDGYGIPYEFYAVDGATIRFPGQDPNSNGIGGRLESEGAVGYNSINTMGGDSDTAIAYIQVVGGQQVGYFTDSELAYGIRNPRTDLKSFGYGHSEIEQVIDIVTGHLNAEKFNFAQFTQGADPKGILNLKDASYRPEEMEGFKRKWLSDLSGVGNSFKSTVVQVPGLEWIDLQKSSRDMEFEKWLNYLIRTLCAAYLIDPQEIGQESQFNSGGSSPLFEASNEWKIKASRDKGLRPLLKFIAKYINSFIIDKIDDHFMFEFIGLDELSEAEKFELVEKKVQTISSLNEARAEMGMPPRDDGDEVLNPVLVQAKQLAQQATLQVQELELQHKEAGVAAPAKKPDVKKVSSVADKTNATLKKD